MKENLLIVQRVALGASSRRDHDGGASPCGACWVRDARNGGRDYLFGGAAGLESHWTTTPLRPRGCELQRAASLSLFPMLPAALLAAAAGALKEYGKKPPAPVY